MSEILRTWLEEQKTGIIANYNAKGRRALGGFERETYVQMDANKGAIMAPPYSGVMLFGRRPNFDQSDEAIMHFTRWAGHYIFKDWVEAKGYNISPYAVAYKVAKYGVDEPTPPNGLVTEVVNDEAIRELGKRLAKDITVRFSNKEQWQISK